MSSEEAEASRRLGLRWSPQAERVVLTLAFCLVTVAFLNATMGASGAGRYMPLIVGIPTLALGLVTLVADALELRAGPRDEGGPAAPGRDDPSPEEDGEAGLEGVRRDEEHALSERQMWLCLTVLFMAFWFLGLLGAGFLFIVGYMLWVGKERVGIAVLVAAGTIGIIHFLFSELLGAQIYSGYLTRELIPMLTQG